MNRAEFLLAAAAVPFALRQLPAAPLAFATADDESHIAVVDMAAGVVRSRIPTRPGPRSIESTGDAAVVAHWDLGELTVLDSRKLAVRHVLSGFEQPRYAAASPNGRYAFVTDSGRVDVATVDVLRGVVVARLKLWQWPRHLSISPDGRTLWVGLGTASRELAVVDVTDPARPRLHGRVRPPFLMHDVGFAPVGHRVWVTSGDTGTAGIYDARGSLLHRLPTDAAPQHVTFLGGRAYVTSGAAGTLRVYDEPSARLLRTTAVPAGSYNVQFAAGRVLTPSINAGTLCVLDAAGGLRKRVHIGAASHDACLARA
jgi:DNA-binding beta-propeller fold protein YncE